MFTDETFYDTSEIHSPDYENAMNQSQLPEDPVERARLQEEWRTDLAKVGASKHETLVQCWFYVGPASQTLDQHETNIVSAYLDSA